MDDLTLLVKAVESRRIEGDDRRFTVHQEGDHQKIRFGGQTVLYKENPSDPGEVAVPVTLPTTPSDSSWYENSVRMLVKSGVLPDDPKKEGQRGLSDTDRAERAEKREQREEKREVAAGVREATADRQRRRQADTTVLRDRAERLFGTIGVWKQAGQRGSAQAGRGTITEVAKVAWAWAEKNDQKPRPSSESATIQSIRLLYKRNTLSEDAVSFWRAFVDHLERAANPARAYSQLLRELLGIGDQREPVPAPQRETVAEQTHVEEQPESDRMRKPQPEPEPQPEPARRSTLSIQMAELEQRAVEAERRAREAEERAATVESDRAQVAADLARVTAEAESVQADAERLRELRNGKVPTLALKALGEMIGTPILAKDETIDAELVQLLDTKRERSVAIAQEILELELKA